MEDYEVKKNDYDHDKCDHKGKVTESTSMNECPNIPLEPGFAKIPVVLAEFTVQIDVESKIKLGEEAVEIKRIKKNVFLTQCRLIAGTDKLFIKGYVRKNIEYATINCSHEHGTDGDIKYTTQNVPFQCTTAVKFTREPELHPNPTPEETTYFDKKDMGKDMKEQDLYTKEFFNEKVFCEMIKAKIYEADIEKDYEKVDGHNTEYVFRSFIEKEVIYLTLKLLQNQQVCKL